MAGHSLSGFPGGKQSPELPTVTTAYPGPDAAKQAHTITPQLPCVPVGLDSE